MSLSEKQIKNLIDQVASVKQDALDCDGCFARIAEFADSQLADQPLCKALMTVKTHLESCPCCQVEYQALLEALQALDVADA